MASISNRFLLEGHEEFYRDYDCSVTPWLPVKNWLYRTFLQMEIGEKTSIALMVMMDTMFPEKIHIGDNTIIGYNTTIVAMNI